MEKELPVSTLGSSVRLCSEMVERVRTAVIPANWFCPTAGFSMSNRCQQNPPSCFHFIPHHDHQVAHSSQSSISIVTPTEANSVTGSFPIQPKTNLMWALNERKFEIKKLTNSPKLTQLRTTMRVHGTYTFKISILLQCKTFTLHHYYV